MIGMPRVMQAKVNSGKSVCGVYLDNEYVLHRIAAGCWEFRMCGVNYHVRAGNLILLYPRLLHMVRPLSRGKLVQEVIHFQLPVSDAQISGAGSIHGEEPSAPHLVRLGSTWNVPFLAMPGGNVARQVERLFRDVYAEWSAREDAYEWAVGGMVAEMLSLFVRSGRGRMEAEPLRTPAWTQLESAIRFIHQHHAEGHLTVDDMADAAGLSRFHFCRVFRSQLGLSPYQYLLRYRIDQAERLLLRAKANCSEVASKTGFSSIHQFSRVFKRITGRAPTAWRKEPD